MSALDPERPTQALRKHPEPRQRRASNGKQVDGSSDTGSHGLVSVLRDRRGTEPLHRTGIFRWPHEGAEVPRSVRRATSSSSVFRCRILSWPIFAVSRAAPARNQ